MGTLSFMCCCCSVFGCDIGDTLGVRVLVGLIVVMVASQVGRCDVKRVASPRARTSANGEGEWRR